MAFTDPLPFQEALDELSSKGLLPTDLSTAELRDLASEIRAASIFSARMNNADAVQRFRDLAQQILSPSGRAPGEGINIATARARMQDYLRSVGYDSEKGGFAGETKVPSAERGSLRDLSSNPRLQLMLDTKVQQMAQSGYVVQQNTPTARQMYPCWELVRVGVLKGGPDAARNWPKRWAQVGGSFYGGRMIAPKDDPIWEALGSTANFDDALDTDIPPYAFGSHMTRRAVARAVCISLGAIKADFTPRAQGVDLRQTAQASAIPFSKDFLADLKNDLGAEVEAGRIRLATNADVPHALAVWLTWRMLAWNDGTSEGAIKGWETRRMNAADKEGASSGSVHPLDATTPINARDLARTMQANPSHPTTKAFRDYFNRSHAGIDAAAGKRIDATLRRLPAFSDQTHIHRGFSFPTPEARDEHARLLREGKLNLAPKAINSASKAPHIAMAFAGRDAHGMVVSIQAKTARDVSPIAHALAPGVAHQQEVAILRGSKFAYRSEGSVQLRGGASPHIRVEEV